MEQKEHNDAIKPNPYYPCDHCQSAIDTIGVLHDGTVGWKHVLDVPRDHVPSPRVGSYDQYPPSAITNACNLAVNFYVDLD